MKCEVDIRSVVEVKVDVAITFAGLAFECDQVLGSGQTGLQNLGDLFFHHFRSDPGVSHAHADLRIDDLWQQIEGKLPDEEQSQHHHHRGAGQDANRPPNRETRKAPLFFGLAHRALSAGGVDPLILTFTPGRKFTCPELTTVSPGFSPELISIQPEVVRPVLTTRRLRVSACTT